MKSSLIVLPLFLALIGHGTIGLAQMKGPNPTMTNDRPYDDVVAGYKAKKMQKIVGGKLAKILDFPWQVSLQVASIPEINWSHFCGGTVLNQRWIITAAHCVTGRKPGDITITAGNEKLTSQTIRAKLKRILVHPNYERTTKDADLALLELDTSLVFSSAVQPIKLASVVVTDAQVKQGSVVQVTGWGATSEGGSSVRDLRFANVPLVDRETICNRPSAYDGWITPNMICAGVTAGGTDSCQGDSGGPLSSRANGEPILLGAVSWGQGCARPNMVGVYTKLANYTNWIDGHVASSGTK